MTDERADFQRQQEEDERRRILEADLRAAAYADYYIRRDKDRLHYGHGSAGDTAPDGRPLYVGTQAYEIWVRPDKRTEKDK